MSEIHPILRFLLVVWLVVNPLAAGFGVWCFGDYLANRYASFDNAGFHVAKETVTVAVLCLSLIMPFHRGYRLTFRTRSTAKQL
jgi:hypothetical protein